jgi:hypothetical protein
MNKDYNDKWEMFLKETENMTEEELQELFGVGKKVGRYLKGMVKPSRGGYKAQAAKFDAEDAAAADAAGDTPASPTEPAKPKPTSSAASDEPYMPISGTEFATMNFLAKGQILNVIRKAVSVGAAAKDPESRNLQQLFNKEFFPALVKMTKNPNIDIAEGIDMEEFLLEMLNEADDALTRRQQAAKKGQSRARGGMKNYLKAAGGKPPIIANNISRALTKALSQNVSADSLFDAAAEVSSTIKDPKAKKKYEDVYLKSFEKNPEKRIQNYKQNVAAFVDAVSGVATQAAAKALASGGNFQADKNQSRVQATADEPAAQTAPAPTDAPRRTGAGALNRMNSRRNTSPTNIGATSMRFEEQEQHIYDAVLEAVDKFFDKREKNEKK